MVSQQEWESKEDKLRKKKGNQIEREREWQRDKGNSTFTEFGPELSYDIFHQKGATLPVATHMFLGWLLTERERVCEEKEEKVLVKLCMYVWH